MKSPIIVVEHGDVTIFESVAKAQLGLESIDVRNGEYVAYDGDGRLLCLTAIRKEKPSFFGQAKSIEVVEFSDVEEKGDYAADLRKALIDFFEKTEIYEQEDEVLSLNNLIYKAVKQFGYTD